MENCLLHLITFFSMSLFFPEPLILPKGWEIWGHFSNFPLFPSIFIFAYSHLLLSGFWRKGIPAPSQSHCIHLCPATPSFCSSEPWDISYSPSFTSPILPNQLISWTLWTCSLFSHHKMILFQFVLAQLIVNQPALLCKHLGRAALPLHVHCLHFTFYWFSTHWIFASTTVAEFKLLY